MGRARPPEWLHSQRPAGGRPVAGLPGGRAADGGPRNVHRDVQGEVTERGVPAERSGGDHPAVSMVLGNAVSADYFRTLGIVVLEGRELGYRHHSCSDTRASTTSLRRPPPDRLPRSAGGSTS